MEKGQLRKRIVLEAGKKDWDYFDVEVHLITNCWKCYSVKYTVWSVPKDFAVRTWEVLVARNNTYVC